MMVIILAGTRGGVNLGGTVSAGTARCIDYYSRKIYAIAIIIYIIIRSEEISIPPLPH